MAAISIISSLSPAVWLLFGTDMRMHYAAQELRKLAIARFPKTLQAFYGDVTVDWLEDERLLLKRIKTDIFIDKEMAEAMSNKELTILSNNVGEHLANLAVEHNMGKIRFDTGIRIVETLQEETPNGNFYY